MASHYHAIVWIDHLEARVFHFGRTEVDQLVLHPQNPTRHIHHKANSMGSGHASEDHDFLHRVALAIADAGAVLITGPANAKTELIKHIHDHDPGLMKLIAGERLSIIQVMAPWLLMPGTILRRLISFSHGERIKQHRSVFSSIARLLILIGHWPI